MEIEGQMKHEREHEGHERNETPVSPPQNAVFTYPSSDSRTNHELWREGRIISQDLRIVGVIKTGIISKYSSNRRVFAPTHRKFSIVCRNHIGAEEPPDCWVERFYL